MHRRPVQEPGLRAYQKQARVGAAIGMKVEDYFIQGPRGWVRRDDLPSQKAVLRPDNYEKVSSTADGLCFVG